MKSIEIAHLNGLLERSGIKFGAKLFHNSLTRQILNAGRVNHLKQYLKTNSPTKVSEEVSKDLKEKGIAVARLEDFRGMPRLEDLQQEFRTLVALFEANPRKIGDKAYIKRLVQDDLDFSGFPALTQYLRNSDLALAAANYLGMTPKLTSFKVWRSHFTGDAQRSGSQNWHRDFNEKQMVRVFLYLNDVSSENGAGEYVTGSHFLGDSFSKLQYSEELGTYATDEEVNANFETKRRVVAEGSPGSLYFIDTAGLHRGGYHQIPSERDVALTTFSTNADLMATNIHFPLTLRQSLSNEWVQRVLSFR